MDLAQDFCFRHRGKFAEGAEAGVIDEDVDGSVFALQLVEEKFGRQWRGQIECDGLYGDAVRLQFGRDLSEFVGAAGDEDQIVMVAGEEFG